MAFKFGELLVREKLITSSQLKEAINHQLLFGGKLGINLIELGLVRQKEMAQLLSQKLRLPYLEPDRLENLSPQTIELIPRGMAIKYSVVPIELTNKKLTLAMADPTDIETIDEIAFRTGFVILPVVTQELNLSYALKKYYQMERAISEDRGEMQGQGTPMETAKTVSSGENKGGEKTPGSLAAELARMGNKPLWNKQEILSPEMVSRALAEAADRNVVAHALIHFAAQSFKRAALFTVRGEEATGWMAMVDGIFLEHFDEVKIPLHEKSVLKVLMDSNKNHVGLIPFSVPNAQLLNAVKGSFQENTALFPLPIMGRPVAVLLAAGSGLNAPESLQELRTMVAKGAIALEILVLKRKILKR